MTWFATKYNPVASVHHDEFHRPFDGVAGYPAEGPFCGHLWARDLAEAHSLAYMRNVGEIVEGEFSPYRLPAPYVRPSELILRRGSSNMNTLHAICFLSYLAVQSGFLDMGDAIGDRGLLHEAIHLFAGLSEGTTAEGLSAALAIIEWRVPGYWPEVAI